MSNKPRERSVGATDEDKKKVSTGLMSTFRQRLKTVTNSVAAESKNRADSSPPTVAMKSRAPTSTTAGFSEAAKQQIAQAELIERNTLPDKISVTAKEIEKGGQDAATIEAAIDKHDRRVKTYFTLNDKLAEKYPLSGENRLLHLNKIADAEGRIATTRWAIKKTDSPNRELIDSEKVKAAEQEIFEKAEQAEAKRTKKGASILAENKQLRADVVKQCDIVWQNTMVLMSAKPDDKEAMKKLSDSVDKLRALEHKYTEHYMQNFQHLSPAERESEQKAHSRIPGEINEKLSIASPFLPEPEQAGAHTKLDKPPNPTS